MLKHIHKQPEQTRQHMAFFVTFLIAIGLIFIWGLSVKNSLKKKDEVVTGEAKARSPFSLLFSDIKDSFSDAAQATRSVFSKNKDIEEE